MIKAKHPCLNTRAARVQFARHGY